MIASFKQKVSSHAAYAKSAVAALVVTATAGANAAVPAEVTTSLGTLSADAVTMATVVLVALIAVFAIKFLRKGI